MPVPPPPKKTPKEIEIPCVEPYVLFLGYSAYCYDLRIKILES